MNKHILTGLTVVSMMVPAGYSLAEGVRIAHLQVGSGADLHVNTDLETRDGVTETHEKADAAMKSGEHEEADKNESEAEDKSDASEQGEIHGKSEELHGINAFFAWLFGHSSTTTIGEIKAEVHASTTAEVGNDERGFFANFLHLLSGIFGGKKDN